jgi:uncharacterized protein with PIN domain
MSDEPIRFLVDDHLRRLARWLRSAGADAAWEAAIADRELYRRSWVEKRTILTMKKSLWAPRLLRIGSTAISEQFAQVVEACGLDPYERAFTRCVDCNVVTEDVPREAVEGEVPPKAYERHDSYRRCPACRKVFWRGVHTERTLAFFEAATGRPRPERFAKQPGDVRR